METPQNKRTSQKGEKIESCTLQVENKYCRKADVTSQIIKTIKLPYVAKHHFQICTPNN